MILEWLVNEKADSLFHNSDGLRERDEPPLSGVKVWLGKKESQVTDEFGYFKFPKARGKSAYVTLDTATLPSGYMLTIPVYYLPSVALKKKFPLYEGESSVWNIPLRKIQK